MPNRKGNRNNQGQRPKKSKRNKSARDNRSQQLNPSSDKYWKSIRHASTPFMLPSGRPYRSRFRLTARETDQRHRATAPPRIPAATIETKKSSTGLRNQSARLIKTKNGMPKAAPDMIPVHRQIPLSPQEATAPTAPLRDTTSNPPTARRSTINQRPGISKSAAMRSTSWMWGNIAVLEDQNLIVGATDDRITRDSIIVHDGSRQSLAEND